MELVRQKNVSTYISFPLQDAAGAIVTGTGNPDSEHNYWADGSAPQIAFADCTNEVAEVGATGVYSLSLTQAEMNYDYIMIQVKSDDALTQFILIRTIAGDPALQATTAATDAIKTDTAAILIDTDTMEADLKTHMDTMKTNLDTNIDATETKVDTAITDIAGVKTDTAAILIDTDTMETDLTTQINANETKIDTAITDIAAVKGDTAAILIDTDTMEADLKTYLDAIETNLETDIEANDTLIDAVQSDVTAIKAITDVIPNAGALTDLKADTAAILIDTDTLEADLKTYLDAIETNLETDIEANDTLIDTVITNLAAVKAETALIVEDTGTTIPAELLRIRGLNGEWLVAEYTFTGDDNTKIEFWQYDTEANFNTHNKSTGLIGAWETNQTFTDNKPTQLKSKVKT